jgi:hypothetical protein
MSRRRRGFVVGLLAALFTAPLASHAQDSIAPEALSQIQALLTEKASRTPVQQRIDSQLLAAYRMKQGMPVAQGIAALPLGYSLGMNPRPAPFHREIGGCDPPHRSPMPSSLNL